MFKKIPASDEPAMSSLTVGLQNYYLYYRNCMKKMGLGVTSFLKHLVGKFGQRQNLIH